MPVVVVEQPEVVDVDERDADRPHVVAGAFDLLREQADQRAVVERVGQRVAAGRLEQGGRLARQPCLCGAEHEEQQPGRDQRRRQRHDDDLAAHPVEAGQDRDRVAPDADDAADLAVHAERQELAQDRRRCERPRPGCGLADRTDGRLRGPAEGERDVAVDGGRDAAKAGLAGGDDRAIGSPELDAQDLARSRERRELALEPGDIRRRRRGRRTQLGRFDVGVDEGADRRGVAADQAGQGRRREVRAEQHRLRGRGRPDDGEERAIDQDEQDRTWRSRARAEHAPTLWSWMTGAP